MMFPYHTIQHYLLILAWDLKVAELNFLVSSLRPAISAGQLTYEHCYYGESVQLIAVE